MAEHTFESLRAEYRQLWNKTAVTKAAEAGREAQLINKQRPTYEDVGKAVGAPWWAVAVLHLREAGEVDVGRWLCVLHNGEKIIGTGRKTGLVPEGRGPFTSFKEAAIDAFKIEGLKDRREWTECPVEFLAYVSEKFNGFGYRDFKGIVSPYLWGGTSVQQRGKYVGDRQFDPNVMDSQIGTMAVLKSLQQLDSSIGAAAGQAPPTQEIAPPPATTQAPGVPDLAHAIITAMERKGYQVDRGRGELNIVYVEGMNLDGTSNDDEANKWNDLRLVIRFEDGKPRIIGKWAATTEPGRYWTQNPMNPLVGAARIEFGQYKSWQVGMHHAGKPSGHEALVQTGGPVTVCRDLNKDGLRTGDKSDTGEFGINHHWGYDLAEVDKASAGCLVGQSKDGHRDFMGIVKTDPRYQAAHGYVFAAAVLPAEDVLAEGPVCVGPPTNQTKDEMPPPVSSDVSNDVRLLQKLLGFSEEEQDGIFGAITEEGVKRFQRRHGLDVTGDADERTWEALRREAVGAPQIASPSTKSAAPDVKEPVELGQKVTIPRATASIIPEGIPSIIPKILPSVLLGIGTVNPFIGIAWAVLPEILKVVVGDKAGAVAGAVTNAVSQVTQTQDPEEARKKLNADPAAVSALQLKLAEIAADEEEKRQQAQLALLKEQNEQEGKRQQAQLALLKEQNEQEAKRQQAQLALLKEQNEQEAKRREAQLVELRADMEDTKDARSSFSALALANNPMALGAPVVSFIVTLGFFGILVLLITGFMKDADQLVGQIINITIGALAAAFATVVSFWLGSSQGSRSKDAATVQLQADQVSQTNAALESQARQAEVLKTTVEAQVKHAEALQSTVSTAMAAKPVIGMKPSNFRRCFEIVLGYEGGFSEEPGDPSGATQFGVTLNALRDFRGDQNLGIDDLKKLGRDEACEIYRTRYWNVLRCDDLPVGIDLVVFDFAVDSNTGRSARTLQQVVGAEADGSIGDATLAATKVMPARDVVQEISHRRLEYYRALTDAANFIRGAVNRTNAVEKAAFDMMSAVPPAP